ncbi:alpha-1,4-glucan--maltose-1-phosphate maltosyltransferase [Winogradskya humida]|uniref:alpha-1,4-glucan--maltose-1-phosphate maltosyltransferase n=1 Tax=Winogradskya humida TaxID=113566 RepID=UPI00194487C1|nr:alpha-1,4-glucan--maltose-1-phosphate maltosyltransferase [Actinoplanes humidus]
MPWPGAARRPIGRIPVVDVAPVVDGGNRPAKSVVGEEFAVTATVFREGHEAVSATVVLTDPLGGVHQLPMTRVNAGLDAWSATVSADRTGSWSYRVEGWSDPYGTWNHDAVIKVGAGVDVELMLEEGAQVLERAVAEVPRSKEQAAALTDAIAGLRDTRDEPEVRLGAGVSAAVRGELAARPLRDHVSASPEHPWLVERDRALYGAWYEFFPRSEGATFTDGTWSSGTFATAAERLTAVAAMGFDVIYLTPIHPIGEVNRKGRNNSLHSTPYDPGSPYAIGSAQGGHDAIHPDLGTFADFDDFTARARALGLEVALDLALNCAPDHPWVTEHPEWFTTRADGSIAYAENPPKKYQDIYPLNFDNDPEGLYEELLRVVRLWIGHGVTIFRVDNPHTKPLGFWERLIAEVAAEHPGIIWLAEAFTRPPMMHTLAKIGFQQSYTYYTWRHTKSEIQEYATELAGPAAAYMRPSFWPTTHDILTPFLQHGGPAAWKMRAALAATLVPTYGIYAGYELREHVARPGAEEQIDNEKYEYKNRHWDEQNDTLAPYLTRLNEIRRAHPALHWLRNLRFHYSDDDNILVFSKSRRVYDRDDTILVVANLAPDQSRDTVIHLTMPELGLGWHDTFTAHDLITGEHWNWSEHNFIRLGPESEPVHIVHVSSDNRWDQHA